MKNPDDFELENLKTIKELQHGGIAALSKQFMQLRPRLREMIASRIHRDLLSRLDASDIVQEVFIRACRSLNMYLRNPSVPPIIWLRLLSKQALAENTRKQYRKKRSPQMEQGGSSKIRSAELLSDHIDPVRLVEREEFSDRINSHLLKLSRLDQEILEMRHFDGLSFGEMTELLNIKTETVKKRYYRAVIRLRRLVNGDSFFRSA